MGQRRNFCDINPTTYAISLQKERLKRYLKDLLGKEHFAKEQKTELLPEVLSHQESGLIKRGPGIDLTLQVNKAKNIALACESLQGLIIHPGETFSFWKRVGNTTKRKGYLDGRVIEGGVLRPGLGGGLCNLANTIHLLVLHSPLDITEVHYHSDALAPDHGPHKPFATGTSVSYNHVDYRFQNNTDQDMQLLLWCEDEKLKGELRCEKPVAMQYRLIEEDHHFQKEGEKYYRVSKIYRETVDGATGEVVEKKLLWDNHSEVMYDPALIPAELIR